MSVKPAHQCSKGDFYLPLEVLVEKSSTNARVTITMWKRQDDKFEVDRKRVGQNWERIFRYENNEEGEAEARRAYEKACDDNVCSPYPEAEKYYKDYCKKKGIKWIMD